MDKITTPEPMASDNRLGQRPQIISNGGPLMSGDDWLQLDATTTDATGSLTIRGRLLKLDGEIVDFNETLTFSGTGAQTAVRVRMTSGWLLGFAVYRASGTLTDGEVQATVSVVRLLQGTSHPVMVLASGDVTNTRALGMGAFGNSGVSAASAPGTVLGESGTNPAAGANFTKTVPSGRRWEILDLQFTLTASATVASRQAWVSFENPENLSLVVFSPTAITATQVVELYFTAGIGSAYTNGLFQEVSIPSGIILNAGDTFSMGARNLQAGDQLDFIYYNVRELPE